MMNRLYKIRQANMLLASGRLIALLLLCLLASVVSAQPNGGEDALKIRYNTDNTRYVELQPDRLPPPHRQMFDTAASLMYAIDRKFQPALSLLPKVAVPEVFVPTMTWYEGKARRENRKWDGRTIGEEELRYVDGRWHHIFYKERSYDIFEEKIYPSQEDAVYAVLSNFVQVRAYWIVTEDPAFKKKYRESRLLRDEVEKQGKEVKLEAEPYMFMRYHTYQFALKMMEAVKPEWVERLKAEAKEDGVDLDKLEKLEPLAAAAKAAYKDTRK